MRIYIAGSYNAPTELGKLQNTERVMTAGLWLINQGYIPFMPHLTYYFDVWVESKTGQRLAPEFYYRYDLAWLKRCKAILLLNGWENSKGCNLELDAAVALSMPIFLESDLPDLQAYLQSLFGVQRQWL